MIKPLVTVLSLGIFSGMASAKELNIASGEWAGWAGEKVKQNGFVPLYQT